MSRQLVVFLLASFALPTGRLMAAPSPAEIAARARALELSTAYVPPPGDPLEHHAAGLAKVICSAVFITGLDPDFALEHVGYFTAPYAERSLLGKPIIDRVTKSVTVRLPNGVVRTARFFGDQGCITLPRGEERLHFTPVAVRRNLPNPRTTSWPMGDVLPDTPLPGKVELSGIRRAVDAAFATPESLTAAFVVNWRGRLIGEKYAAGITRETQLESWSMGKSTTAALIGLLIREGVYRLEQQAPIPEWQAPGDPRSAIRIIDLLQMTSGLRIRAPQDPEFDPQGPYPDHVYFYTGAENAFSYAATRPLQWSPGRVGRYRNTDPVLLNYLIRLAVEKRGQDYLSFPQRALFDRIGIRSMIIETDPYGNFLTQGYDYACARDWARLGTLFLQDGTWNGERLLPEGFVGFVRTSAPAWVADGRPTYGGSFWINSDLRFAAPHDAYYMAGAGGQWTLIIPSHDLVVVRMGHFKGATPGQADFNRALKILLEAIPPGR